MIDAVDVLNGEIARLRAALSAAEERATTLQRELDAALARVAALAEALESISDGPPGGCHSPFGSGCDGECEHTARAALRALAEGKGR